MTRKQSIVISLFILAILLSPAPAQAGFFSDAWESIKGAASSAISAVSNAASGAVNAVSGAVNAVKEAASAAYDTVKTTVSTAYNAVKTTVSSVANAVVDTGKTVWNWLTGKAGEAGKAVENTAKNIEKTISDGAKAVDGAITSGAAALDKGIESMIAGAKELLGKGVDFVSGALDKGKEFIQKLDVLEESFKKAFGEAIENAGEAITSTAQTVISEATEFSKELLSSGKEIAGEIKSSVEKMANASANSEPFKTFLNGLKNSRTDSYLETGLYSESHSQSGIQNAEIHIQGSTGTQILSNSFENNRWSKGFSKEWGSKGESMSEEEAQDSSSWGKPTLTIDLYRDEHTYTVGPQLNAGITHTAQFGNTTLTSSASTQLLAGAEGSYGTSVTIENGQLQAGVEASGFIGLRARGQASSTAQIGNVGVGAYGQGEVSAGAGAEGSAMLTAGRDGIGGEIKAEAFVGVRARGEVGTTISYGDVSGTASVNGTIGAGLGGHFEAAGKIGWDGVKAHVDMGAYLGVGGQLGFDVNINFGGSLEPVRNFVTNAADRGREIVSNVGTAVSNAWDSVKKSKFNPANWFQR